MGGLLPFKSSLIKGTEFLMHESDFTNDQFNGTIQSNSFTPVAGAGTCLNN